MITDYTKKTVNGYVYNTAKRIGNGFSSQVFHGLNQKMKEEVAIKVIGKAHKTKDDLQMIDRQISCLQTLNGSPNIVQIQNAIHTKHNIYIITEFCSRGSLAEALAQNRKFSETQAIRCILQIINGYKCIAEKRLVHRDLKLVNIFITSSDELKIGDFGFAIDASLCKQALPQNVGSPLYEAPETLTSNLYSTQSDIWAIGVIFIEMLLGKNPWKSTTETQLVRELGLFRLQNIFPCQIGRKSRQFLSKCLRRDISQRMSLAELIQFSFTEEQEDTCISLTHSQIVLRNVPQSNSIKIRQQLTLNLENSKVAKFKEPSVHQKDLREALNSNYSQSAVFRNMGSKTQRQSNPETVTSTQKKLSSNSFIENEGDGKDKRMLKKVNEPQNTAKNSQLHKRSYSQQQPQGKSSLNLSVVCSKKNAQHRKPTFNQKQILLQAQSQINYFRFLRKLLRKIHDILKTNEQKIMMLKENIFYMINSKIKAVRELKGIKQVSPTELRDFKTTLQYQNLQEVLRQYQQRYDQQNLKDKISIVFESGQQFNALISYACKVLYKNVANLQQKSQQFNRKQGLIYILQDLIELMQLHALDQQQNWPQFMVKSNINSIVERVLPISLQQGYWPSVKKRFLDLGDV